jgi:hypothetical protein
MVFIDLTFRFLTEFIQIHVDKNTTHESLCFAQSTNIQWFYLQTIITVTDSSCILVHVCFEIYQPMMVQVPHLLTRLDISLPPMRQYSQSLKLVSACPNEKPENYSPALVTACLYFLSWTSPAAKTPGIFVSPVPGSVIR